MQRREWIPAEKTLREIQKANVVIYTIGLFSDEDKKKLDAMPEPTVGPFFPEAVRKQAARYGLCKDEFRDNGGWPPMIYIREARRMRGEVGRSMWFEDLEKDSFSPLFGRRKVAGTG